VSQRRSETGYFPDSGFCQQIAFDGAKIWLTNPHQRAISKMRASDGRCSGPSSSVAILAPVWRLMERTSGVE